MSMKITNKLEKDISDTYIVVDPREWFFDSYNDLTQTGWNLILELRYRDYNLPNEILYTLSCKYPVGSVITFDRIPGEHYTITDVELVRGTYNGTRVTWFTLKLVPF